MPHECKSLSDSDADFPFLTQDNMGLNIHEGTGNSVVNLELNAACMC